MEETGMVKFIGFFFCKDSYDRGKVQVFKMHDFHSSYKQEDEYGKICLWQGDQFTF